MFSFFKKFGNNSKRESTSQDVHGPKWSVIRWKRKLIDEEELERKRKRKKLRKQNRNCKKNNRPRNKDKWRRKIERKFQKRKPNEEEERRKKERITERISEIITERKKEQKNERKIIKEEGKWRRKKEMELQNEKEKSGKDAFQSSPGHSHCKNKFDRNLNFRFSI